MVNGTGTPLLNPILSLLKKPTPSSVSGGGKNAKGIVHPRLEPQKLKLSEELAKIHKDDGAVTHAGKMQLLVKMFDDSFAPSWTPNDLFQSNHLSRIVAPAYSGYLVEISKSNLPQIIDKIKKSKTDKEKVDVSRMESISDFNNEEALRKKTPYSVFSNAKESGYQFNLWLIPFYDVEARNSVADKLELFVQDGTIRFGDSKFDNVLSTQDSNDTIDISFKRKVMKYKSEGMLSFTATIDDEKKFNQLLASGMVYRIESVTPIAVKSMPPGEGTEPKPRSKGIEELPTVVIVDGGCSAISYLPLNVMEINPLVSITNANLKHGNQVTSVVCQASAWNNNLALPDLECNFISVQAINKDNVSEQPTPEQFINYLRAVAVKTKEASKVWNLSFNEAGPSNNNDEISYLGLEINKIARDFDILPIISIGNVSMSNASKLCPPADCESALTIAGRTASPDGLPDKPCPLSLRGPAPAGMKKPELSWFSTLRMIGGTTNTGTSYSTPLISAVAAHTFRNIKDPSPDLVKALLINKSERHEHDSRLGWGTPWTETDSLPWLCETGSVTLAWSSKLRAGFAYYWNDIPLPPEMIVDGKIKGEIILTAILKPIVSELGGVNYFSTRLQCALQSVADNGKVKNLLGSMKESKEKELESRNELAKWSPIRHHGKKFSSVSIDDSKIRLHARIFTRDLYQFGLSSHHDLDEQSVSFVLTFKSHDKAPGIYNSMKQNLGTFVEVGTIEQDIDVDNSN
ncbi:S8 family peptidase [Serratia marcescens]|nr:S8 family peptidase [Serratia marcescens]MBN5275600.1 S8 family peptidase [Serratia marcescens]MBN5306799.1 S8 family peptidase [Serratia marcescens]MBN5363162.1 S8 family peptidase [Serratia marcescens]MBN5421506.1 S8 family peptidase [Serratia marcescens]